MDGGLHHRREVIWIVDIDRERMAPGPFRDLWRLLAGRVIAISRFIHVAAHPRLSGRATLAGDRQTRHRDVAGEAGRIQRRAHATAPRSILLLLQHVIPALIIAGELVL